MELPTSLSMGYVFLDVGTRPSKYAILTVKKIGSEDLVIAVEPHPENYKILVENIRLNGSDNVIALNTAT